MSDETTYDAQIVVKREEWTRTDQDFRPEAVALGDRPLFKAVVTKDGQRFALRHPHRNRWDALQQDVVVSDFVPAGTLFQLDPAPMDGDSVVIFGQVRRVVLVVTGRMSYKDAGTANPPRKGS